MQPAEIKQTLQSCEFFKGLGDNEIEGIAGICRSSTCEEGEFIFRQGDFGEHLYIIAEGQVYLERTIDIGARKGSVVIETLGKGRVLGCWSTMLNEPHILMSSAVCHRSTTMLTVKGAELRAIMTQNTDLGFKIMEKLCFLLRDRIQAAYGAMEKI